MTGFVGVTAVALAAGFGAEKPKSKPDLNLPEPPVRIADAAVQVRACLECHQEIADLLEGDKHIAEDFHCVVCHGESKAHIELEEEGTLPDRAWRRWDEKKDGYHWRMEHASLELARFCASCHDRKSAKRRKGKAIKTIDWKDYLDTGHGLGVAEGDRDSATCTDCHYAHGVGCEPLTDETIVVRCGLCHGDKDMMKGVGLDLNVMQDFEADSHENMRTTPPEEKSSCIKCHYPH